jgi:hypothetical protein
MANSLLSAIGDKADETVTSNGAAPAMVDLTTAPPPPPMPAPAMANVAPAPPVPSSAPPAPPAPPAGFELFKPFGDEG